MSLFKPKIYKKDILSINYDLLKKKGIQLIAFDLDNTLTTIDEKLPRDEYVNLINKLSKDFKVVIVSNNIKKRVRVVAKYLNCDYFYSLLKPTRKLKKLIEKKYNVDMSAVCIIGDQIVTDVVLGNRIGSYTVLVDPLGEKDLKITFFNRIIEKVIKKRIKLNRGMYYEED